MHVPSALLEIANIINLKHPECLLRFSVSTYYHLQGARCGKVMFSNLSISHSVHRCPPGQTPPLLGRHSQADTPQQTPSRTDTPLGRHPPEQTPPRSRHSHPEADTPYSEGDTPWKQTSPQWPLQWTVHIIQECILVQ